MTEAQQVPRTGRTPASYDKDPLTRTAWFGWVYLASIMMTVLGAYHAIAGLVALFDDGYYLVTDSGLVVSGDYTGWGFVHLILGAVAFAAGFATMAGRTWGRATGIVLVVVSAVVNMTFIAAYPVWLLAIVTFDVIIIYALAVHGRGAAEESPMTSLGPRTLARRTWVRGE